MHLTALLSDDGRGQKGTGPLEAMVSASPTIDELISRVAVGDRIAFTTLYARTSAKLFGVTLRILVDRSDAEEALQEVYVKIWQRAESYMAGGSSPINWLVAVARNHALDILGARKSASDENVAAPATAHSKPDLEEVVRFAYLGGYSYEDLAALYDLPLDTMRTWVRCGLLKLDGHHR